MSSLLIERRSIVNDVVCVCGGGRAVSIVENYLKTLLKITEPSSAKLRINLITPLSIEISTIAELETINARAF